MAHIVPSSEIKGTIDLPSDDTVLHLERGSSVLRGRGGDVLPSPGRGGPFGGRTDVPNFPDGTHPDLDNPNPNIPDNQPGSDNDPRKDDYPSDDRDHNPGTIVGPGFDSSVVPFVPDSSLSPEENLSNLQSWIDSLFASYHLNGSLYSGLTYANILSDVWTAVYRFGTFASLDSDARAALTEKIADQSWALISQQFTQALSYQTWYLQQEYNSPLNQVNRLAAAGLNSAFALGNLTSGNAQSPAGVSQAQPIQPSGAAEINRQGQANEFNLIGTLVSAASSFVPGAAGAVASLVSSFATKKLTAKQIQLSDQEIINSAATFEKIKAETNQIASSPILTLFDSAISQSNNIVQQKGREVDLAQSRYDTSLSLGTYDVKVSGYRVKVVDKEGRTSSYDMTVDQTKEFIKNGGKTSDGKVAVGVSSWEKYMEANGGLNASLNFPGGKIGADGGVKSGEKNSGSQSNSSSRTREASHEVGSEGSKSMTGYNDHGTSFRIGDTQFDSIEVSQKMTKPEHKAYIESCRKELDKALSEYNTLSTGERARMLDLLDHTSNSLSSLGSRLVHSLYMSKINSLFVPRTMIGD